MKHEYEAEEVRRAFEEAGLGPLLVSANGSVSPHLAVLRLLRWMSDRGMTVDVSLDARPPRRAGHAAQIEQVDADAERQAAKLVADHGLRGALSGLAAVLDELGETFVGDRDWLVVASDHAAALAQPDVDRATLIATGHLPTCLRYGCVGACLRERAVSRADASPSTAARRR